VYMYLVGSCTECSCTSLGVLKGEQIPNGEFYKGYSLLMGSFIECIGN
jgi:hypothetical protein